MTRYVALLRGINVGGKNIIPMAELRDSFELLKFNNVVSYIQSGNVLFSSRSKSVATLTAKIEKELSHRFSYSAKVVVLSKASFQQSFEHAPKGWGKRDDFKHNALFVISNQDIGSLLAELPPLVKTAEFAAHSPDVLFWSVNKEKLSKSTMMKLAKSKVYQSFTVRNHKTYFKISELFDAAEKN